MTVWSLPRGLFLCVLLLAAVFSLNIRQISDTDTWMHLSLGRAIWDLGGLPAKDPFPFTTQDNPFYYSSWLFGTVYYLLFRTFGAYGPTLLKAFTVTAAFYIMLRDSLRPCRNYAVSAAVLAIIVFIVSNRFVERPDTLLMLFLTCNIYFLNSYVGGNNKYIYSLPLINMLWANCHLSVPLILVIFPAFMLGGLLQSWLVRKGIRLPGTPTATQMKTVALVFAASVAASMLNPFFIKQYLYGAGVLSSPWAMHNIVELQRPIWPLVKAPFLLPLCVLASFGLNWRQLSITRLFLVLPFLVLPLNAQRFILPLALVAGPVIAGNLSAFLNRKFGQDTLSGRVSTAVVAAAVIALALTPLFGSAPGNRGRTAEFGINYRSVPEGALKFMDREGINGRVFNHFHFGGYIHWRDFPGRTAYIDPRVDLPEDALHKMDLAWQRPDILDEIDRRYGVDAILAAYPLPMRTSALDNVFREEDLLLSHPGWSLVYWDDLSLVYLKKGGRYGSVAEREGYRYVRPANFSGIGLSGLHDETYRTGLINELRRNIKESGSSRAHYFLGLVQNETGHYAEACEEFAAALENPGRNLSKTYSGMAEALVQLGRLDEAAQYYEKSLDIERDPSVCYRAGLCHIKRGDAGQGVRYLEQALKLNPDIHSLYRLLASTYRGLGREDKAARLADLQHNRAAAQWNERHAGTAMKAYLAGRFDQAFLEFEQAIRVSPRNPVLYSSLGYTASEMGMTGRAFEYQRMALEIDPGYADAHYGLALISKKWGENDKAKGHWEEYLKSEPSGRYADKAREELGRLGSGSR